MELVWQTNAWEDYLYWQQTDKKMLERINNLIKDKRLHILQCRFHYQKNKISSTHPPYSSSNTLLFPTFSLYPAPIFKA